MMVMSALVTESKHDATQHAEEYDRRPEIAEQRALNRFGELVQRPVGHVDKSNPVEWHAGIRNINTIGATANRVSKEA
jgi:hypothetical protein